MSGAFDFVLWHGQLEIWLGWLGIKPSKQSQHKALWHKKDDEFAFDHDKASNGSAVTCWRPSQAEGG
jgi:hypothetical protein